MNILRRLGYTADAYSDETALVSVDGELTYRELFAKVDRYAAALGEIGIEEGERFNLLMENSARTFVLLVAGWQIGAIPSPINIRLGDSTIEFLVEDSDASVVVLDETQQDKADVVESVDGVEIVFSSEDGADIEEHLPDGDAEPGITPRLDRQIGLMLHTSGTTGRPKWVRLSHHNLASSLGVMVGRRLDDDDKGLHYYPLYHSGGIDLTLSRLLGGATTIIGSGWDAEDALQRIEQYEASGIDLVPQMGYELVHHEDVEEYDLSSLEYVFVGADTVSEELAGEFQELGAQPVQAYGLTETMAVMAVTPMGETDFPLDSTGRVIEDVASAKIVDPESGEELPPGEVGEMMITGDKLSPGYYNRPEQEAKVFENGWLHTEDLAKFDEEGYLYITGRLNNMMIVGGENVYPTDVEDTLEQHPDVSQAIVVAMPDERKGEVPIANVILEENADVSEDELKQWFIDHDAAFKHPRHVRFIKTVPTTPVGKLDRASLEEQTQQELDE